MSPDKPYQRMTLRQLMTHAEKSSRTIIEQLHSTLLPSVGDFRELSRPVRRRSHYPTLLAIQNALQKLQADDDALQALVNDLNAQLDCIGDGAKREKVNRL